jgi:Pro-kumamolisin, activation domain
MLHHGQAAVPVQMASWCHEHVNGVVVKSAGLLSRREKEIALYSSTTPTDQPQVLSGHVPQAVANSRVLHELSGATRLNLAIGLPLRNQSELDSLLFQLSDPASPNFGHYLSAEQFAAEFGPTEQDYRALISKRARAAKPLPRRRKTASTAA